MASIRQIFMLYIFVALLCHFGDSHKLSRGPVGKLNKLLRKVVNYLDLKYLRFRQQLYHPIRFAHLKSDDFIEFPDDIHTPWDGFSDSNYEELDDYLSNSIEDDDKYYMQSKEYINKKDEAKNDREYKNREKTVFPTYEEPKLKPYHEPKELKKTNIELKNEKPNLLDIYSNPALYDINVFPRKLLSPYLVPYLSNPVVPKTNSRPIFVPNSIPSFPRNVEHNGAPYTGQPNNIFGNFIPELNNLPIGNVPNSNILLRNRNGAITNGLNPLTIPNNRNIGNKPVSNYVPTGALNNNGYYPKPYPGQQMYYWVQLSNGQVILVPEKVLFGPNNGQGLGPEYGPIFLPNNYQIFAPGQNLLPIQYNDYMSRFNYGQRYVPGQNLPRPRIVGVFPGNDQAVPYFNGPDYLKLLKYISKGMVANGKTGVRNTDQGVSFIDQDLWRFGEFETHNTPFVNDAVSLSAFKEEAELPTPEKKNKELDAKESEKNDGKTNNI